MTADPANSAGLGTAAGAHGIDGELASSPADSAGRRSARRGILVAVSVGSMLARGARCVGLGFSYVQLVFIGVFLFVGPWWALRGGLSGAVLLLAALGLLFDLRAFGTLLEWAPVVVQRLCVRLAVASHLVASGWALVELFRPIDAAWAPLADSENWSDPLVAFAGADGFVVHTGGGGVWARTEDGGWRDLGEPPGGRAWEFLVGPDGALWTAPRGTARLDRRDPRTGQWRSLGRPAGELSALAVGTGELLVIVGSALHRLDMAQGTWAKVQISGRFESVAVGGGAAAATGSSWWSRDDGGEWVDVTPADKDGWTYVAVGGAGWRYTWHSGIWSSDLRVAPPGRSFERRSPPAPDLRVVVPDPRDGARAVAGSWGQGVWLSEDGGATWSALGLARVQVRSLAVDWRRGVVCAASANTIWHRGVFCRDLPHGHPSGAAAKAGTP